VSENGQSDILDDRHVGIDWDRVFAHTAAAMAGVAGRPVLNSLPVGLPVWLTTAINQTRAMLDTFERASWEDHLDTVIRPQLDDLLETLLAAAREVGDGNNPVLPPS